MTPTHISQLETRASDCTVNHADLTGSLMGTVSQPVSPAPELLDRDVTSGCVDKVGVEPANGWVGVDAEPWTSILGRSRHTPYKDSGPRLHVAHQQRIGC